MSLSPNADLAILKQGPGICIFWQFWGGTETVLLEILVFILKSAKDVVHLWWRHTVQPEDNACFQYAFANTQPSKVNFCLGISTLQVRLKQGSNCSGRRLHVRQGCGVVIAHSARGKDLVDGGGVKLSHQPGCTGFPWWLHQILAFAFLSCDKRTKPPTEELPAESGWEQSILCSPQQH